jgi:hypothetical protein
MTLEQLKNTSTDDEKTATSLAPIKMYCSRPPGVANCLRAKMNSMVDSGPNDETRNLTCVTLGSVLLCGDCEKAVNDKTNNLSSVFQSLACMNPPAAPRLMAPPIDDTKLRDAAASSVNVYDLTEDDDVDSRNVPRSSSSVTVTNKRQKTEHTVISVIDDDEEGHADSGMESKQQAQTTSTETNGAQTRRQATPSKCSSYTIIEG